MMFIALVIAIIATAFLATEGKSGVSATLFMAAITVFILGLWPIGVLLLIASFAYHIFEGVKLG